MTKINLTIKTLNSDHFQIEVDTSSTVQELKQLLLEKTQIPVESQRLIFMGKVLKDSHTLESYAIPDGGAVHLVRNRPPDAARPAPAAAASSPSTASSSSSSSSPAPPRGATLGAVVIETDGLPPTMFGPGAFPLPMPVAPGQPQVHVNVTPQGMAIGPFPVNVVPGMPGMPGMPRHRAPSGGVPRAASGAPGNAAAVPDANAGQQQQAPQSQAQQAQQQQQQNAMMQFLQGLVQNVAPLAAQAAAQAQMAQAQAGRAGTPQQAATDAAMPQAAAADGTASGNAASSPQMPTVNPPPMGAQQFQIPINMLFAGNPHAQAAAVQANLSPADQELEQAVISGSIDRVRTALAQRPNVNFGVLHKAVMFGHQAIVTQLVEAGANISARSADGLTALHAAIRYAQRPIVEYFLSVAPAKLFERTPDARTCLLMAVQHNFRELVELLLNAGANVHDQDPAGHTAVMIATTHGNKEIVELLLRHGAKADARDGEGCSALHYASRFGFPNILAVLLQQGLNVNMKSARGETPLCVAAFFGQMACVQFLLSNGADPSIRPEHGASPLMLAQQRGFVDIANYISRYAGA